jgi:uncharacterized protein YeaO (DUF488 family)
MPERIGACFVYHVAITRAPKENRCVAPSPELLAYYKSTSKSLAGDKKSLELLWQKYAEYYLNQIRLNPEAQKWIQSRSAEAIINNILLVCFEKDPAHCHRRLLAEEIVSLANPLVNSKHAEYRGDFLG